MKGKVFRWLLTAAAVAILSGGATPVGNMVYDVARAETQVRADSTVSFDATTGTLTLKGNVVKDDVQAYAYNPDVKAIYAEKGTVLPKDSSYLFEGFCAETIDLSNADTSKVTSMSGMFYACDGLSELNLSGFDTSKVTIMVDMFFNCSGLSKLDLSGFDTSNVTDMSTMFSYCSGLSELDLSGFDTSKVRGMRYMFESCSGLSELDLNGFDTSNVTDMVSMFSNCSSLSELDLSGFDTSNVTDMTFMFSNCSSLSELDVSGFDTSKVTDMASMFSNCSSLSELDLSGFDTSKVTDMVFMFSNCSSLSELDLSGFDTSNVTDMTYMFNCCSSLSELDVSGFDTSNVTKMSGMFSNCSSLSELDVSGLDTLNVTNMGGMFDGCSGLSKLDLSGFDTSSVTDMGFMFFGCSGLKELDVSGFVTSNVTSMYYMFAGCEGLSELDVSGLDTLNVTNMGGMFDGCSGLSKLDLSGFDTSNVTSMICMFSYCSSLSELNLSGLDTSSVTDMGYIFNSCSGLSKLDISSFNTSNVTKMYAMFAFCTALKKILVSESWNTNNLEDDGAAMFNGCQSLVGGNGTACDLAHTNAAYARIDREGEPGYFTDVNAKTELVITKQPRDWYGTIGKKGSFSVEATGDDLSYEWQYKKSGAWHPYGVTSYDTPNFSISMNAKNVKWPIRCVITDKYGRQAVTKEVWLKDSAVSAPITITKQPVDWTGVYGKKATFTVEASGNGLTYQWQYRKGSKWTDYGVTGADTATLKVTMNEKNAQWPIRCKITDEDGFTATTKEVSMRLKGQDPDPQPVTEGPQITKQPSDWYGIVGKKATFSVEATGSELSYQWQYKKGTGAWTDYAIATADTANFSVTMNEKTMKWAFRCVITDKDGNTATTNEVYLKLKGEEPAPAGITISGQPGDYTGKIGKKATFTVTATGEGLTYEWQVKKATTWSAYTLAGYDTPTFQVSINDKTAKWTYRCVIRDANGNEVATNEVKIIVAE